MSVEPVTQQREAAEQQRRVEQRAEHGPLEERDRGDVGRDQAGAGLRVHRPAEPGEEVGDHEEQHRAGERVAQHVRAVGPAAQAEAHHRRQRDAQIDRPEAEAGDVVEIGAAVDQAQRHVGQHHRDQRDHDGPAAMGEIRATEQGHGFHRREIRRMRQQAAERGEGDHRGQHQRAGRQQAAGVLTGRSLAGGGLAGRRGRSGSGHRRSQAGEDTEALA